MTKDNVFTILVKAKEHSISDVKEVKEIVKKKNRSEISIGKVSNGHSFENDRNAISRCTRSSPENKKEKTYLSLEMCGSFSNLYKPGVNFNSFFCFAD